MRIAATATAYPPHYFTQQEVVQGLLTYWDKGMENSAVIERLHSRTGVDGRYFCRPLVEYYGLDTWGKTNDVWIEVATALGEEAIDSVLKQTGVDRSQVGALFCQCHGSFKSIGRCPAGEPDGAESADQAKSDLRAGLCGRSSGAGARIGLCSCLS